MVKKKGAIHFKDGHVEYILSAELVYVEDASSNILIQTNADEYICIETLYFDPQPYDIPNSKQFKFVHEYFKKDSINNRWITIEEPERIEFYPKKKRRLKRRRV